jgi:hypothetical protein
MMISMVSETFNELASFHRFLSDRLGSEDTGLSPEEALNLWRAEHPQDEYLPEATDASSVEGRFQELAAEWKEATAFTSSLTEIATHPAYQRIIGMGKQALPLILDELRREPDHWFWALKAITGDDPVAPSDRGNLERMAAAWLDWADKRGYARAG